MSTLNAGETLQPFKPLRNNLIFDSSGNLVGIQNDRANGNDFRIGGGSGVDGTFATLVATTAIKINSGARLDLYNTADQATNYERLRASFVSNRAEVGTFYAGTGTPRQMRVGAGTSSTLSSYLGFYSQQFPFIEAVLPNTGSSGVLAELFKGTFTGPAGTQTIASIQPTINQSGTAGYIALDINPTETATGSGTKLLQRWAVDGSAKAQLSTTGVFGTSGLLAGSSSTIGFSSDFTLVGQDVSLNRDAADTLALRRSTNAQTFRVYNTYTDGSNYERLEFNATATGTTIRQNQAGTGLNRGITIITIGSADLTFGTANANRWVMNTGGHFLANADNTYDIGASGANRPRIVYAALSLNSPEWRMSLVTVAGLSGTNNSRMMVSDATVPFTSANVGTAVVGGGANTVPVIRIGGTWYIG